MHINVTHEECKRCGRCCVKGGPVLHTSDRVLVVDGILSPVDLLTIRRGEPGFDPCHNKVVMLESELIKVRGRDKIGTCKFYDPQRYACLIYDKRPMECRLLKCWDTKELEAVFMRDLLIRRDLVPPGTALFELIERHDLVFDLRKITEILLNSSDSCMGNTSIINKLIEEERCFRQKVIRELSIGEAELDFFFGRPLEEVVAVLGP